MDDVLWYAATVDVTRMGPFSSQLEAWSALRRADGEPNKPGDRVWPERPPFVTTDRKTQAAEHARAVRKEVTRAR